MTLGFDRANLHFTRDGRELTLEPAETEKMCSLAWWQRIPLAPGLFTPGREHCASKLPKYNLEMSSFKDMDVLGIGCYEGFQLYFAEALGARRVVGVSDTFGHHPEVKPARDFIHRLFKSQVEFIDCPVYELSPDRLGQFDVVMFYDVLPHLFHPAHAMEKIFAMSRAAVLMTTPFLISSDPNPFSIIIPSHGPLDGDRNCTAVNNAWLEHMITRVGFRKARDIVHENDYASIVAARIEEPLPAVVSRTVDELPDDRGCETETAVLIMSCEKYREVWAPFFTLFKRYWPDCPYRIYFGTDRGDAGVPGVTTIAVGEDRQWAANTLHVLQQVSEKQIILFQEDFLLTARVNTEIVRKMARHALDFDLGCIRLRDLPPPTGRWPHTDFLGTIGPFDDWRFSFQLSLWKREMYTTLLAPGENPWTTEFVGARRSVGCREPFLSVFSHSKHPIPYLAYAIDRGKWTQAAVDLLITEQIPLPASAGKPVG